MAHFDHVARFFGYHDCWDVCVAGDNSRHDATINDSQFFDSVNSQLMVNDCHRIGCGSHFGCASGMINRLCIVLCKTTPVFVREPWELLTVWRNVRVQCGVECSENFRFRKLVSEF